MSILLLIGLLPAIFLWYFAACILLLSIFANGAYDAIILGSMVNPYVGSISTFALIYFCIKMHKFAKAKILAQIERDRNSYNA